MSESREPVDAQLQPLSVVAAADVVDDALPPVEDDVASEVELDAVVLLLSPTDVVAAVDSPDDGSPLDDDSPPASVASTVIRSTTNAS